MGEKNTPINCPSDMLLAATKKERDMILAEIHCLLSTVYEGYVGTSYENGFIDALNEVETYIKRL